MASAAGGVGGVGAGEECRGGRGGDIRHRLLQGLRTCEKKEREEWEARESKAGKLERGDEREKRLAREATRGREERGDPGMDGLRWMEVVVLEEESGESLVDGHGTRQRARYKEGAGEAFEAGLSERVTCIVGNPLAAITRDTSQDSSRDMSRDTSRDNSWDTSRDTFGNSHSRCQNNTRHLFIARRPAEGEGGRGGR